MTNHEGHIALWDWLSKHPSAQKHHWPGWEKYNNPADFNRCFACLQCGCGCKSCPIKWSEIPYDPDEEDVPCTRDDSPYFEWVDADSTKDRALWATQIRDMEWKSGGHNDEP